MWEDKDACTMERGGLKKWLNYISAIVKGLHPLNHRLKGDAPFNPCFRGAAPP